MHNYVIGDKAAADAAKALKQGAQALVAVGGVHQGNQQYLMPNGDVYLNSATGATLVRRGATPATGGGGSGSSNTLMYVGIAAAVAGAVFLATRGKKSGKE